VYGKIFDLIYDGTLYGHWEAIVTMQQLIVLASPDGVVDMTPPAIAARTSIPLDIITKGLKVLSEPDPYTRTPGEDGRRIVLMDEHRPWGWRLVNHGKYQRLRDMKQKRQADRDRIAEKRKKTKDVATESQGVANVAPTDSDSNTDSKDKSEVAMLPAWLPLEAWKPFLEMRRKKKIANGPRALNMLIAELERLKSQGFEPAAVIDQSTLKGWTSFYPLKAEVAALTTEPAARLCDYCAKPSTGAVNGRRACSEHWHLAMDNEKPAKIAA
jgi:hypothetical protein